MEIENSVYIPTKIIEIENHIENDKYKMFFNDVVSKFVFQQIPSNAIFKLHKFEIEDDFEIQYYNIITEKCCRKAGETTCEEECLDGCGEVFGGGSYGEGTVITISAVAGENCVFVKWVDEEGNEYDDSNLSWTVAGNFTFTAIFEEKCAVSSGFIIDECEPTIQQTSENCTPEIISVDISETSEESTFSTTLVAEPTQLNEESELRQ